MHAFVNNEYELHTIHIYF